MSLVNHSHFPKTSAKQYHKEQFFSVNLKKRSKVSRLFLNINNELSERETRNTILFTIATTTTKIRYLGINLTKEVKDINLENYRTLKKEIEDYINKCKHI